MRIHRSNVVISVALLVLLFSCTVEDHADVVTLDGDSTSQDAGALEPKRVTIATFNVKAFFDPVCDSGRCSPRSFEAQPTESEFEAKARQLAQGVRALNADVVLLQEIEKATCLQALQDVLADEYPTAFIGETNAIASLDVGVISRLPLVATYSYIDEAIPLVGQQGHTYFEREFLEVHLDLDGEKLVVFNAHFRSKNNDDPAQRLAEASAAHEIVTRRIDDFPAALIVLGGDLNDVPGSSTLNALEQDEKLIRVAAELGSEAATYVYRGVGQAIDHLYLGRTSVGRFVEGSSTVIRNSPRGLAGSDHSGLVGSFLLYPGQTQ